MGTQLTVRETEILTMSTAILALVSFTFVMYNAIFPNI